MKEKQKKEINMYAVLSLDLDSVSTTQRDNFYKSLKNDKWVKINNLTTTWYVSFKDGATEKGIINTAKSDVKNAASYANVQNYNAMVTVSKNKPTEFNNK